jgi:hypothetical protein
VSSIIPTTGQVRCAAQMVVPVDYEQRGAAPAATATFSQLLRLQIQLDGPRKPGTEASSS